MRAIFVNNPAGNDLDFRISPSLYLPNIKFVVYYWVLWTEREPSVNGPSKDLLLLAKTYYYREPSVNRAWNLRKHILIWKFTQKNIAFLEGNRHEFALQKLQNVSLSGFSLQIGKAH